MVFENALLSGNAASIFTNSYLLGIISANFAMIYILVQFLRATVARSLPVYILSTSNVYSQQQNKKTHKSVSFSFCLIYMKNLLIHKPATISIKLIIRTVSIC